MDHSQQQQQKSYIRTAPTENKTCEFTTTQENLAKALRTLSGVAGRNPALPILSNVLLKHDRNQLRLSSTDLEVGITSWLPGKLRGEGELTVPLKPFAEYIQNLPSGSITLAINASSLFITAQGAHAVFQGETAENFPIIPYLEEGLTVQLPPKAFSRALDEVLYAIAIEDTRPELTGVLIRGEGNLLTLAATDSYRLAESKITLPTSPTTSFSIIIPGRSAQEIRRVIDSASEATLRVGEGQVLLLTPSTHIISRRVEGNYPDYAQIIPQKHITAAEVDRLSLLRTIRASAVFSGNTVSRVMLEVSEHKLRVEATTPEIGNTETDIPADVHGEHVAVAFNERFLRDALSVLSTDRVRIEFGTSATPAVLRPVSTSKGSQDKESAEEQGLNLALIMPIKT